MSADPAAIAGCGESPESLTERMDRAPLRVEEICLRDLHGHRLVCSAVNSQLILLGPADAAE